METPNQYTILVVDDTKANIDVLMTLLGEDYDLAVALDGEQAMEIIASDPPDLILLDVLMPGIDGYEVCRRIKLDPRTRDIPVIFQTSLTETGNEIQGLELGAVDYVTKPFCPAIVKARVANHLALLQARRELEKQNEILLQNAKLREDVERITRHDLKAPLSAIINLPQVLMENDDLNLQPEDIQILKMIEDAGYKMLNMINLSLDLYKMEEGTYVCRNVPVDLLKLFRRIAKEFQNIALYKQLRIEITVNGQPARENSAFHVQAEELLCYSMFANLIKNSIEAAPNNTVITISCARNDARASVGIHNMGAVPEGVRDCFFEKYSTAGKDQGTGLGTYSARLIATTQGGDISMETSEENGTTITVGLEGCPDSGRK